MSDNLNGNLKASPITMEDIYTKLEELVSLQKDSFREIIHIANSTSSTQIMLAELSQHLGLIWDDEDNSHDE